MRCKKPVRKPGAVDDDGQPDSVGAARARAPTLSPARFTILRSITLLRQLSLHPGPVDKSHDDLPCAKLGALVEQQGDVIGGKHRALVFSQFTGFLAKVRDRLDREGIGYCYLDGRTRRRDRARSLQGWRRSRVPD
jgi:SNF2 family DNA or RNA helicase